MTNLPPHHQLKTKHDHWSLIPHLILVTGWQSYKDKLYFKMLSLLLLFLLLFAVILTKSRLLTLSVVDAPTPLPLQSLFKHSVPNIRCVGMVCNQLFREMTSKLRLPFRVVSVRNVYVSAKWRDFEPFSVTVPIYSETFRLRRYLVFKLWRNAVIAVSFMKVQLVTEHYLIICNSNRIIEVGKSG